MDAEFLQLARAAVAAMQGPSWVEIAQLVIHGTGVTVILVALWQMGNDGKRRDREIDAMEAGFKKQAEAFDRQNEALEAVVRKQGVVFDELLRRPRSATTP